MLYGVLRAIFTVVTPRRIFPPYPTQLPPETGIAQPREYCKFNKNRFSSFWERADWVHYRCYYQCYILLEILVHILENNVLDKDLD